MSFDLADKVIFVLPSKSPLNILVGDALRAKEVCVLTDLNAVVGRGKSAIDGAVLVSPFADATIGADQVGRYSESVEIFCALAASGAFARSASIVLVIGTSALRGFGDPSVAAAEAALNTFLRTFALTLVSEKVRFNTVMHEWAAEDEPQPTDHRPRSDEVAGSIAFFLSDASRWMTRSRLLLDAGASLKANLGF